MTWTRVDYDVALEVASHEAVIRQAYKDSVGKWTWSVGLTSATGHNVERYIGKPQTLERCFEVYAWALNNYADAVREVFAGHTLSKAQFAAAVSFHWNTGAIKRASWARLWKAGDINGARAAFMQWNKPSEIVGRRRKECDLFFDGKWSNNGTMTEYTRLTSRSTPDWGSARRINVERELRAAFKDDQTPHVGIDTTPDPDAPVDQPTLSPSDGSAEELIALLLGRLLGVNDTAQPSPPPQADPNAQLTTVLTALVGALAQRQAPSPQPAPTPSDDLTPVNAALGQTVGRALNGKKTAISLATVLATVFLPPLAPVVPVLGDVLTGIGDHQSQILPVAGAGALWGALGKIDKWFAHRR